MLVFALMTIGTPQSSPRAAPRRRRLGVLARGLGERLAPEHGLDRAVDAVVAIDAIEVPLHHLRDGVFLLRVQAMQLWHRDVQQVAVDRGAGRRLGSGPAAGRNAEKSREREDDERTAVSHPRSITGDGRSRAASTRCPRPGVAVARQQDEGGIDERLATW